MIKFRAPLRLFQRTWEEVELETLRAMLAKAENERDVAFVDVELAMGLEHPPQLAATYEGIRDFTRKLVRKARVFALLIKLDRELQW
jgi:hypothetical protein